MCSDELEHLLTEYLDGTLSPARRSALQKHLDQDPNAQARLELYRALDELLRVAPPLPPMRWDALAKQISAAIPRSPPKG
ncbi:MAG TPA: zf-HC2 domain-containing protein [Tepidisphaeraceae bacterium]|jgi:anti-sigma factor RsiW|nr:zf-HC2 domain-containing protein [Tepidisphaeraceae bacterium]